MKTIKKAIKRYFYSFQYSYEELYPESIIFGLIYLPFLPIEGLIRLLGVVVGYPFKLLANWLNK